MTWMLILISVESATPMASYGGDYSSMTDCFAAREYVMEHLRAEGPAQAVCVRTKDGQAVKVKLHDYMPH